MGRYKITNERKAFLVRELQARNISYWEVAEELGVHENTVIKWMRKPDEEHEARIFAAIEAISQARSEV